MIEVSAGIIRRDDGRILVCQRGVGRNHAHLWEFPGGKRESGENAAACLCRELLEELSLPVDSVQEYCIREAEGIRFTFLTAHTSQEPVLTEHEAMKFCTPREFLSLPFCPADTEIARQLAVTCEPVNCFLWDFDGTLADTYPQMVHFLSDACKALGFSETDEHLLDLMKASLPEAIDTLAAAHGISSAQIREAYEQQNLAYQPALVAPMPGILSALHSLKGRHYLVTHRDLSVLRTLEAWGTANLFSGHMLRGDAGFVRKPSPDGILRLIENEHIDPKQAVMIGDRPLDMQAGKSAGILVCLLDPENRFPDEPADLRAKSAEDLPRLLQPKESSSNQRR